MFLKKLKKLSEIKTSYQIFFEYSETIQYCAGTFVLVLLFYYMLAGKRLTDFTSLFSPYEFEKNDDISECNSVVINKRNLS